MTYKDGTIYRGAFCNGIPEGYGEKFWNLDKE